MNVYRLDPIDSNDASWQLSTVRKTVWAAALTPDAARQLVASTTLRFRRLPSGHPPKPISPWLNEKVTTCVWDTARNDLGDGDVVTADGTLLSHP